MGSLEDVAKVYNAACERGEHPTKAVVLKYRWTRSKASRYVAQARNEGLIPPADGPSAPTRNRKAVLVAEALGVDYDELCNAIWQHAEGDLRV